MSFVLTINGQEREFSADDLPGTVSGLLEKMGVNQATIVAEVDGDIVPRDEFGTAKVVSGMKIELIRFVGGG